MSHPSGSLGTIETLWDDLARRQHGVVSRRQLLALKLSRRQVERRIESGSLVVVHRGVYRVVGAERSFDQDAMAACLATGGIASHRCAAALWGLRGCEPGVIEVTVVGRRHPEVPGVIAHSAAALARVDRTHRRAIPVTAPARTLLDLAAVSESAKVESALEDGVHRGLVSQGWAERTLQRAGGRGRAGTAALRGLLAERAPGQAATESVLEDEIVRLLRHAGLPPPVRQFEIAVPGGKSVRIDLAYPEARLAIEAQSMAWHAGRADLQRDCDKQNLLARLGWRLLTFTWQDARTRPTSLVATVDRALGRGRAA